MSGGPNCIISGIGRARRPVSKKKRSGRRDHAAVANAPGLEVERRLWAAGQIHVCGVDEAGRGPLAGPVVAGAVVLPSGVDLHSQLPGLNDSKQLAPSQRSRLEEIIHQVATARGIGLATVAEIDAINIRRASLLAMKRAVTALAQTPSFLIIDGRDLLEESVIPSVAVKGGDRTSASVAAASILAKEARDRIMRALSREYPEYGWEHNMGYPTAEHRRALRQFGITPHHRRTFKPVAELL
ncbi:MAG: ribonuclease HII [Magnetococcales bacterium]|nr:ribonuclease HII [Magnetococcales bacterium]